VGINAGLQQGAALCRDYPQNLPPVFFTGTDIALQYCYLNI
jgi:hypothetical protein